jgi:hypothetical protein
MINTKPINILWGEDVIGNVSAYPALPSVLCHRCGSKLYRVYNTQTAWGYLCLEEKILVDPANQDQTLDIELE